MKFEEIKNFWFNLPRIIRYIFTGGYNFAVSYLIFAILVFCFGDKSSQICLFTAYFVSSFNSYFSQKFLVFQTRGNYVQEYLKCATTWLIGYFLNAILLYLMQDVLSINVYISEFIAMATVSVITYILFKYFSFKK